MLRLLFWTLFLYWFVRFVVNFIFPIFRVTRQMRHQVREFQTRAGSPQNYPGAGAAAQSTPGAKPSPKARRDDYIDFEEVR